MALNSTHRSAWRRMRFMAVSLLAQPHNVDGLVTISKLNSFTPNIHQLESVQSSRRHQLPSLKSIGDPERNSDREKRSRDRNASGDSAGNNNSSKRRRRNNGKYNRQRRSTGSQNQTPDKSQDGENILSKGQESKIRTSTNNSLRQFSSSPPSKPQDNTDAKSDNVTIEALTKRVVQLETLVSSQMSEMQKLRREMDQMASTMGDVVNFVDQLQSFVSEESNTSFDDKKTTPILSDKSQPLFDDDFEIFGVAPTTIKDAADSAGQSILSAILAGKNRMLVDVRDAELTRDPALLVEFIELAVLPVAAGLQGLDVYTNRVKIVFPTVEELLGYRKYMALAAPEVVSLSTLGFDPVEEKDNLIVIVAPSPDDVAGCDMMQKLLERMSPNANKPLSRPVVIINHHMMPIDTGSIGKFTVVYHLRLLSVQYMTGDIAPEYVNENNGDEEEKKEKESDKLEKSEGDSALEAAMTHAREIGVHQGVTRAMVIRAYPKPWHVFVDVSPDTDADFEVAATFDSEPSQEDVNYSIVECLEGSEREDELVAKQMQAALDAGQLTRVSEMLGISPNSIAESIGVPSSDASEDDDKRNSSDTDQLDDWDEFFYDDWLNEDSV